MLCYLLCEQFVGALILGIGDVGLIEIINHLTVFFRRKNGDLAELDGRICDDLLQHEEDSADEHGDLYCAEQLVLVINI